MARNKTPRIVDGSITGSVSRAVPMLIELFTSPDYLPAEKWADEYAGDCEAHAAVVEDFDRNVFLVLTASDAAAYIGTHDAEIQYEANGSPR